VLTGLEQLAVGYFNQDYDLDYPNPMDAVVAFAAEDGRESVDQAAAEVEQLLNSGLGEDALAEVWIERYGSSFEPTRYGMTYHDWLVKTLDILRTGAQRD